MSSPSANLGIHIFSGSDQFNITQYDENWEILDLYPGFFVCTSTTRPGNSGGAGLGGVPAAWGAAQNGQKIVETDTGLTWRWNGTIFVRDAPSGCLGRVVTTTTLGTTSTWSPSAGGNFAIALTQTVTIPNGTRQIMVNVEAPEVTNTTGLTYLLIQRVASSVTTTLNSWPVWTQQQVSNSNNPGSVGSFTCFDSLPVGASATYSLCYAAAPSTGGTSYLTAGFGRPVSLTITEL